VTVEVPIEGAWLALMCLFRLVPVLIMTPILGGIPVPARVKVFIVLAVAATLASMSDASAVVVPSAVWGVARQAFAELAYGAMLAFGIQTAFAAYSLAGSLIDLQMGFGLGSIFDPVARRNSALIASAMSMTATVSFFTLDLHHEVFRAIALGIDAVPLGAAAWRLQIDQIAYQFGTTYVVGVSMAAPVVFILFLLDMGFAVMSRSIPQLNVLFIGPSIKILVGLLILVMLLREGQPIMTEVMRHFVRL